MSSTVRDSARVAVAMKWVDLRPEIDRLTGVVRPGHTSCGFSASDRAALEVGLRISEEWSDGSVVVAVAGAEPDARAMAELGAVGVNEVRRVPCLASAPPTAVAAALAAAVADSAAVVCGDHSLDRGSGAVPPSLASHLDAALVCGVRHVEVGNDVVALRRRLDGGRTELVEAAAPVVISVEAGETVLRRGGLSALFGDGPDVVRLSGVEVAAAAVESIAVPYRPPARRVDGPHAAEAFERVTALTHVLAQAGADDGGRMIEAEPAAAAEAIIDQLVRWGYLDP